MSSSTSPLLDTLLLAFPDGQHFNKECDLEIANSFLNELLNDENVSIGDANTEDNDTNRLLYLIAELENDSIQIDKQINNKLTNANNLELVLNSNTCVNESFNKLDSLYDHLNNDLINNSHKLSFKNNIGKNGTNTQNGPTVANNSNTVSFTSTNNYNLLYDLSNLIEIMELPTIINSLIKQSLYNDCIELSSLIKHLKIRFNDNDLINKVDMHISNEINDMIKKLSILLTTNIKQSSIVKIITYLKRLLNNNNNYKLKIKSLFLHCRFKFIIEEIKILQPLKTSKLYEKYIKRCIEIFREFTFQTILTFESCFEFDKLLIYKFTDNLISYLCEIVNENLIYIDNKTIQDSIFLQMIYFCQSLSRTGADFTAIIPNRLSSIPNSKQFVVDAVVKQKKLLSRV